MAPSIQTNVAIAVGSVSLAVLGAIIFNKIRKGKIPTEWDRVGTLKEIYLYPLKSAKGIRTKELYCTNLGVKDIGEDGIKIELRDRSFVIYTSKDGEVRTARQLPKIVLIEIQAAANGIILSASNKNDIYVNVPKVKNNVKVVFGNEPFICTDCGDSVAKWLSNVLLDKAEGLRLGYGDGTIYRDMLKIRSKWALYYTSMEKNMSGIFCDVAALHFVNQATVDDLNAHLPDDQKVSFLNFRPNLYIEGPPAFDEDVWKYVKVGEVVAKVCLDCLRCIGTTVNPNGVMNKEREPQKTLERYRKSKGPFNSGVMGIYLKVIKTGKISEGDDIYVAK